MAKKLELRSLIGSEFIGGSPVNNTFKVATDGEDRFFSIECYAPIPRGNIFAFAHCYNAPLKDDTDRYIADVIYDGEVDYAHTSTNITFINGKGDILYAIFAYEGRHRSDDIVPRLDHNHGHVWVKEISGTKVQGVEELV